MTATSEGHNEEKDVHVAFDAEHRHSPDGASGEHINEDSDDGDVESIDKDGVDKNDDGNHCHDESEYDNGGNLGWSKEASATGVVVRNPTFHRMPPKDAAAKVSTEGNDSDDVNNDREKGGGDSDDDDNDDDKDDDNNKHFMTVTVTVKSGDDATSSQNVLHNKEDDKFTNDEDDKEKDRAHDSPLSSCVSVSSRDLTATSGEIGNCVRNDNEDGSVRDLTEAFASTLEKKMSASSHRAMLSSDNAGVSQYDEENDDVTEKMDAFQLDQEDHFDNMPQMKFEDFPDISPQVDSRGRDRYRRSILHASPWSILKKYVRGKVWRNRSRQRGEDSSSVVTATTATKSVAIDLLEVGEEETESWNATFIPSMSTLRSHFGGVMLHEEGMIVVMGGRANSGREIHQSNAFSVTQSKTPN